MPDLLYEIGTEEMPAGYLEPALEQLADAVRRRLEENRLPAHSVRVAGTPRRMAVFAQGIPNQQPPLRSSNVGPPAAVAYDEEGNPTPAALGFARSMGVDVEDLQTEQTDKGPYVAAVVEEPGLPAVEVLPEVLRQATAEVSLPKSMRWESSGFQSARPIRSLVALLDGAVLELQLAGVQAGRTTRGHAFLAPGEIELARADWQAYRDALREARVVVDLDERRTVARQQINDFLRQHGPELKDARLLEEVTNLVEWPHAVEGTFDEHFLQVPAPILVAAMKEHQRYFPMWDEDGHLAPRFVTLANRTAAQDDLVREGNERVLLARLDDAEFFWNDDRERGLEPLVPKLQDVVFLAGLGDNLQRTERLEALSVRIAEEIGEAARPEHVRRAAHLCKADLLTGLVGEFPSLQGVVGRELALVAGEPEPVADAIAEHYLPTSADDDPPASTEGCCLAVADKLDVITGCFSLGLLPSGSQDPYALRRNALGILMIIEQHGLNLRLSRLVQATQQVASAREVEVSGETCEQILDFFRDRLYHAALERGHRHDFVRAALAAGFDDVNDFWKRVMVLEEVSGTSWWPDLVELVDRTYRIQRDLPELHGIQNSLLQEPLEKKLAAAVEENTYDIMTLFEQRRYAEAAEKYCSVLAELTHDFFEEVYVNVDDEAVRVNRKSICGNIYRLFADNFADLYLIETADSD